MTNYLGRTVVFTTTLLVAVGLGGHSAKAQNTNYPSIVYSTDFTSDTSSASVAGQDGWYTTSGNYPGPGSIQPLNFTTDVNGTTANWFVLGGSVAYGGVTPTYPSTMPDTQTTTLLHEAKTGTDSVFINSTFDLYTVGYSANGPGKTQSALGFSIYNTTGYNLMDIKFTPVIAANNSVSYTMGVVSYGNDNVNLDTQILTNTFTGSQIKLSGNTFYDIGVAVTGIGTANQSIGVYSYTPNSTQYLGTTQIMYNDFSSSAYNDGNTNVGAIGMSWHITDGSTNSAGNLTNFGVNTMLVQNITASIPEPKTWVLFGISALIMVVAIRRRA